MKALFDGQIHALKERFFQNVHNESKIRFQKSDLTEQTGNFSNPARGFYQIYTFCADKEPDFEEMKWCLDKEDSLALLLIDIGRFYDRELDKEALSRIRGILDFFAKAHYDIILRAVYDREGKGMEREPSRFSLVERHLEQIGELFSEFEGSIFIFQGMLVGNWGEMHGSRHLAGDKMKRMADILGGLKGKEMYLAVRRPAQWRELHTYALRITEAPEDGMGLFDDGIFGSESHLGTFGSGDRVTSGWNGAWGQVQEMAFEEELGKYVPNGGEAVYGEDYTGKLTCREFLDVLKRMHITYLNKAHDVRTLDIWKHRKYEGAGVWAGKSLYDYIGAHLGYRFVVKNVCVKKDGQQCFMEIEIENTGFAGFYQEGEVFLEWEEFYEPVKGVSGSEETEQELITPGNIGQTPAAANHTDQESMDSRNTDQRLAGSRLVACDIRQWEAGRVQKIRCMIEECDCKLYLSARRKIDGAVIHFANLSREGGRVLLGCLRRREAEVERNPFSASLN